jgi:hypothetical protein
VTADKVTRLIGFDGAGQLYYAAHETANGLQDRIVRFDLTTHQATPLVSGLVGLAYEVLIDGTDLYWIQTGLGVRRMGLAQTTPVTIASHADDVVHLLQDESAIYFGVSPAHTVTSLMKRAK